MARRMHPLYQQIKCDWELPSKFYAAMLLVWISRSDLQETFPLHKMHREDYRRYLAWCAYHGRLEYTLLAELPEGFSDAERVTKSKEVKLKLLFKLHAAKFLMLRAYGRLQGCYSWLPRLAGEAPQSLDVQLLSNQLCSLQTSTAPKQIGEYPFGVNLFGYSAGELGIGEDLRMLALAFECANVPFCIVNVEPGRNVSQKDLTVQHWVVDEPIYVFNIFCMTGFETCRYILESGLANMESRYNIGLWPWELENWPSTWRHAYTLVDEIWGISEFTSNSYRSAPVPVVSMPLPVVISEVASLGRSHWNLPPNAYLFVFSFDMNSTISRKNPRAVIEAFKQAAQDRQADEVGLVLKISHNDSNTIEWREIKRLIAGDSRIHVIPREMRKPEVLALYSCCDCYVSLHRSEGFGRALAEAQLLGLVLIATGYSGNLDFCSPPTHLVDYQLVSLGDRDYPNGTGQRWADPDITHAASLIRACMERSTDRASLGYSTHRFSAKFCGGKYSERLNDIVQSRLLWCAQENASEAYGRGHEAI